MKTKILILALILSFFSTAQNNSEVVKNSNTTTFSQRIDTVYKAPQDKEVFYFNGYEAPERIEPDFVLKENGKVKEFEIDKNCDVSNPISCVALYHYHLKDGHKWFIKTSIIADKPMQVTYGQRVGSDGDAVTSTIELAPGTVRDMGYGKFKDSKEREVWIISASWK